ncbi:MAG: hypothetical protein L6282_03835, partial [Candidatus Methanoperedenaceae archaeon]|nr:hypothetical protein [Candidatus Methanoperedenaceae archaeon]
MNDFIKLKNAVPEEISLAYVESKIEIHFRANDGICGIRSCVLHVLKTQRTTVFSIKYREFIAVETLLFCPEHKYDGNSIIKYDSTYARDISSGTAFLSF